MTSFFNFLIPSKTLTSAQEFVRVVFRSFALVAKKHPRLVWPLLVTSFLGSLGGLAYSAALALFLNHLKMDVPFSVLIGSVALLVAAGIVPEVITLFRNHFDAMLWRYLEVDLEIMLAEKLSSLDMARHENPAFQDLTLRATSKGTYPIRGIYDENNMILGSMGALVVVLVAMSVINTSIVFLVVTASVPILFIKFVYGGRAYGMWDAQATERRIFYDRKQHLTRRESLKELQLEGNVNRFLQNIESIITKFTTEQNKLDGKRLRVELLAQVFKMILLAAAIYLAVMLIINDQIALGTFTFVLGSIWTIENNFSQILSSFGKQREVYLNAKDLFSIFDTSRALSEEEDAPALAPHVPHIEFRNVSFHYPHDHTKKLVLKNFNLVIKPRERIALIGVNGAGKSTLIKLLARFYDPTEGSVLIDGIDLRTLSRESWYEKLSILFQDFQTYHFTIREAIALSRSSSALDTKKVVRSAERAQADEFIREWPKQYEEQLGVEFEGRELSYGQKQKIALARAFYRDPHILVLDEPTSAIDAAAEEQIFEHILEWSEGKTLILISHRFSTVRNADRIIILKNGQIYEDGSHTELMKNNKIYAELFRKQARAYQ